MYLQGNLQNVFDALYHLGVIDPVLEMDWSVALEERPDHMSEIGEVLRVANQYQSEPDLLKAELQKFDQKALGYLAMEVAREFADFHSRDELH